MKLVEHTVEVGVGIVTLVYEEGTGNTGFHSVIPSQLGTDLKAGLTVDGDDSRVRHTNALQHFAGEIQVAGGVQHVDLYIFPHQIGGCQGKGETAADFFCIIVANRSAVGSSAETVDGAGAVKHRLGKSGFTASAVSEKRYVADGFCRKVCHIEKCSFCLYVRTLPEKSRVLFYYTPHFAHFQ